MLAVGAVQLNPTTSPQPVVQCCQLSSILKTRKQIKMNVNKQVSMVPITDAEFSLWIATNHCRSLIEAKDSGPI